MATFDGAGAIGVVGKGYSPLEVGVPRGIGACMAMFDGARAIVGGPQKEFCPLKVGVLEYL